MPSTLYNPDGSRTGLRINARSRRTYHMGGEPRGGLFTEPTKGEKWEMHERARARRDAAASSVPAPTAATPAKKEAEGMLVPGPSGSSVWKTKPAPTAATPAKKEAEGMLVPGPSGSSVWKTKPAPTAATPAKKEAEGMLVPGPSGSSVWKTKDQIKADAEKRASRAAARGKGVNMTPATSPKAQPGFTFPKLEGGRPRVATFAKFKI